VRDEEWLVTSLEKSVDGTLIRVQGLSELVRDTTAAFYSALDDIQVVDPAKSKVVADDTPNYRKARLFLETTLRKTPTPQSAEHLTVSTRMLSRNLKYQQIAVAKALDTKNIRPRILIADAVGLGKTLEIGMILSELVKRGRGERILVVTPRHVLEQMQHELWCRFALPFVRLDSAGIQKVRQKLPATRNPFTYYKRAIISIDTLKSARYRAHLGKLNWDAVVIDESHNDPAHGGGRIALMLHDKVPGGTGYLAEFADSKRVWELLHAAWEIVLDCSCRFEERLACHHCLLPHVEPWQVDKVARASAERLLGLLLRSGQKPVDGETPPSFAGWTVTEEAPSAETSIESLLEKRFRKAWMDRLKAAGTHTKVTPGAPADTITFRIPGQNFQWQLLPQVDVAGTRPDFLLKGPPDPNFPVLAIYTDGFAFHASPERNRIADDAEKRDKLRHTSELSSAVIPWAVTWEDVNAFELGPSAPAGLPSWANAKLNAQLMAKFPVDASIMGLLGRDAMSILWQWVNKPNPEAWTKFSELVPLMLMKQKPQPSDPDAVYGHAVALARGEQPPLPTGSVTAWTCRSGSVGFAAAGSPNSLSTIAVGLCLDDRQDALVSSSHEASWRLWLQLSNLLAFKPIGLTIGSVASCVSAGSSVAAEVARQEMADEVGPAWKPLLDQATEFEKTLLLQLATAGLDILPELGYEVDGVPVSIAWPDHHLAVVFDGDEREGLEASGWTTVGIDVEEIRELLKAKGA